MLAVNGDRTMRVRVVGGDGTIGETVSVPIDRRAKEGISNPDDQFFMRNGFPYHKYEINPRYSQKNRSKAPNIIQDRDDIWLAFIRQMVVMYAAESRIDLSYHFTGAENANDISFPLKNYAIKPFKWNRKKKLDKNNKFKA